MDGPGDYYTKSDKELYDTTYMWNLKKKKNGTMNLLLRQKQTQRLKRMNLRLWGKGGTDWDLGIDMYTLLYVKDNQQRTYCIVQGTILNII